MGNCRIITDASLMQLAGMTELRRLDIGGYMRITDDGMAALQERLPDLEVAR